MIPERTAETAVYSGTTPDSAQTPEQLGPATGMTDYPRETVSAVTADAAMMCSTATSAARLWTSLHIPTAFSANLGISASLCICSAFFSMTLSWAFAIALAR